VDGVARFIAGITARPLTYQLTRPGDRPWGLEAGDTVEFFMRRADLTALVVDAGSATVIDLASDTVKYEWRDPSELPSEGMYRGWFVVTRAGVPEHTDEFDILVADHAPGEGTRTGAIWRAARGEGAIAWDALRKLADYGDPELQRKIDVVKLRVLGAALPVESEAALDVRVADYIGKLVAIEVIPAAIDFWMDQVQSTTIGRGAEEIQTFPNRISAMQARLTYLERAVEKLESSIIAIIGRSDKQLPEAPTVDTEGPMITPGLEHFPAPYTHDSNVAGVPVGTRFC
jgi:hypothetical protein